MINIYKFLLNTIHFSKIIIGLIIISITYSLQAINIEEYVNQLPSGANLAFIVQKVGAQTPDINYHGQQMALPASTQKIVTTLAALLQLGPSFRFSTTLERIGNIENNVLKGDLIVRFGADPTLKRQDLRDMIVTLKQSGVHQINGNIVIDTSIFASHDKAPGWPWNDLTRCFSTPLSAAIVDRNCFSIALYSAQKPNDLAFIRIASYYPVSILSQVRTLEKKSPDAQYCELDVIPGDLNRYTLTGCLPKRANPLMLTFAIQDGASYAGDILKKELMEAKITYTGKLLHQTQTSNFGTIIASKKSEPLYNLLKIMLKTSDNLIADTIFRMIGHVRFGVPGTWRVGSIAVRQVLYQQAGINLGNTIAVDGSGLSRHNLISPKTMMQILQYLAKHDSQYNFISMLPLAGYDGSLQHRAGLHAAGVNGKVYAKTGSMQGVYNLAGFITTASGQRMAFVQYLSGYAVAPTDQRNILIPLVKFESKLYKDIYLNN